MTPLVAFQLLCVLIVGHFLIDYPWCRAVRVTRFQTFNLMFSLIVHSLAHGIFVWLVLDNYYLGVAEMLLHGTIDWGEGRFRECDQDCMQSATCHNILHILGKGVWVTISYFI